MTDDFFRDLRHLQKADALIGKIWLNVLACQLGLFLFAGLIAIFGLGMTNVSALYALQASLGPVWAAVVAAIADFVLAAIVILVALPETLYSKWHLPDNPSVSCRNEADCYPTEIKYIGGDIYAKRR